VHRRRAGPRGHPGARALIAGLVQLLAFQGIGEIVSKFLLPLIPGPVIGLVLLIAFLKYRKTIGTELDLVATTLTQHLGLLFIPAAVGVVMFWPQLRSQAFAVAVALVASVVLCIAVTAVTLRIFSGKKKDEQEPA
jgi:holin-like protein